MKSKSWSVNGSRPNSHFVFFFPYETHTSLNSMDLLIRKTLPDESSESEPGEQRVEFLMDLNVRLNDYFRGSESRDN